MNAYTILTGFQMNDDHFAVIHRAGCKDVDRDARDRSATIRFEHTGDMRSALDRAVDDEDRELGFGDDDVRVYPCAE